MSLFTPQQLDQIVAETLPAQNEMPEGHCGAVVATVDSTGAGVVVGFHLTESGDWTVQGVYHHNWTGENIVGGKLIGTF